MPDARVPAAHQDPRRHDEPGSTDGHATTAGQHRRPTSAASARRRRQGAPGVPPQKPPGKESTAVRDLGPDTVVAYARLARPYPAAFIAAAIGALAAAATAAQPGAAAAVVGVAVSLAGSAG
ncbi:hypothetical protein ACU4GD_44015 [Cupriavidus basilensis]